MKALTCEMCGSTNLIKKDGVFVCQSCGTQYSVEEAKKMMVEGTVDVKGTVKVDTSDELKNLYEIARRAKDSDNYENAAKYYDMILVKDPQSWEANFYLVYSQAMCCKIAEIANAAQKVHNTYPCIISLIKENVKEEDCMSVVQEITDKVTGLSSMLSEVTIKTFKEIDGTVQSQFSAEYMNHAFCAANISLLWGDNLYELDKEKYHDNIIVVWKNGVDQLGLALKKCLDVKSSIVLEDVVKQYENKISQMDTSYVAKNYKAGCYIATAVYGSYDCPQVWTLRRYRDYTLAETRFGRAFIKAYYATSPTMVKWFGETSWFKSIGRKFLDKKVKKLNDNGVADTRYCDKQW